MFEKSAGLIVTVGALAFNMLPLTFIFVIEYKKKEKAEGAGPARRKINTMIWSMFGMIAICLIYALLVLLRDWQTRPRTIGELPASTQPTAIVRLAPAIWDYTNGLLLLLQIICGLAFLSAAVRLYRGTLRLS